MKITDAITSSYYQGRIDAYRALLDRLPNMESITEVEELVRELLALLEISVEGMKAKHE